VIVQDPDNFNPVQLSHDQVSDDHSPIFQVR
jgi:hypothetical protein